MAAPITIAAGTTSHPQERPPSSPTTLAAHRTSQHSLIAKNVLMSKLVFPPNNNANLDGEPPRPASALPTLPSTDTSKPPPPKHAAEHGELKPLPFVQAHHGPRPALAVSKDGVGAALSDTPAPSQPGSPRMYAILKQPISLASPLTYTGLLLCA